MPDARRDQLKAIFVAVFEQTLEERIDRYLEVNHQWITGNHHFASASSEAIDLYRDGYFTSCIMVTQAVSEGIIKFVADRNGIKQTHKEEKLAFAVRMLEAGIVSKDLVEAFGRIQRSFRNDFHHMNPPVAEVDVGALAKRNILDLATIEREIFECRRGTGGTVMPSRLLYWDINEDGSVPAYLRLA